MQLDICPSDASGVLLFRKDSKAVGEVTPKVSISWRKKYPKFTLHCYDHCPYCVRVRLTLGWKGIPYETKVYGYGASSMFSKCNALVCDVLCGSFLQVTHLEIPKGDIMVVAH